MNDTTLDLAKTQKNPTITMNTAIYFRRRLINRLTMGISMLAMVFGLFWLCWILLTLVQNGISGIHLSIFTHSTPPPGESGGLANAIVGSLLMTSFGTLIGTPIGILSGVYLAEFGNRGWLAPATRFINDILLSAPSIVIGLFVYEVYVVSMGHFSGWAGALALSLLVIPVVVRTTENMLRLVPSSLREAAVALGTPQWKVVMYVTLRAAKSGVITGILLAVARITGETAPLLFTASGNQFLSHSLSEPVASLPRQIYTYAKAPYSDWHRQAWAGALVLVLFVFALSALVRLLTRGSNLPVAK